MPPRPPWASPRTARCGCGSEDRRWDQSCSLCAPHQLAFDRPGISPRLAASRSLVRANPNLRYTPRERPVIEQRLRCRDAPASRGCAPFRSGLRVADQLFELSASRSVFLRYLEAFLLAHEHIRLGHELLPYLRNGKLKASRSARPCLSSCADVEMVISMPRI